MSFLIPLWARALAVCLVAALLVMLYLAWAGVQQKIGYNEAVVFYEKALTKQRAEAAALLELRTKEVAAKEKLLLEFKNSQEVKDVQNAKTVADLARRLRELGGLRDPGKPSGPRASSGTPEGPAPTSPSGGPSDTAKAGGLLSDSATEFLLAQALEADEINSAYISCRADAMNIRVSPLSAPLAP